MCAWQVTPPGSSRVELTVDVISNFTDDGAATEVIAIDGETQRLGLRWLHGLGAGWEWGFEAPVLRHSGGFLDGLIIDWHDLFGFPQGGRDRNPRDRLVYRYRRNDRERVRVTETTAGFGDITLQLARQLGVHRHHHGRHLVARGQLKLPTGDADRLFGSGGWDAALSLQLSNRRPGGPWWALGGGLASLGPGEVLPELQRHWQLVAGLSLGWQALPWLSLQLQGDAHSAPYHNTELGQLGDPAVLLSAGASAHLHSRLALDFVVIENELTPDASPDVAFQLRLRSRF